MSLMLGVSVECFDSIGWVTRMTSSPLQPVSNVSYLQQFSRCSC